MKKKFLLSVIIPTKNRQKYVIKVIEQILEMNDDRVQIVIQDNSDEKFLEDTILKYKNETCLKYHYTSGIISFVDNFSMAVSLAEGEYACIIGDDDGITPQLIEVAAWASANQIKAVKPSLDAVYFWPNSEALGNKKDNGYLNISNFSKKSRIANPEIEVKKLLKQGGQDYLSLDLVKLYHGLVRKDCLDNIKNQTGYYFGGLTPDIYMSVALSLTIEQVIIVDFPLTISGICSKSGSADSVTGKHTGKLEDAPHFKGQTNYTWSEMVPQFYSVETIWADSVIAALKDLGKYNLIKELDVNILTARCLKNHPEFEMLIKTCYRKWLEDNNKMGSNLEIINLKRSVIVYLGRVIRRIKRELISDISVNGVVDIKEANNSLQEKFKKLKLDHDTISNSLNNLLEKS